MSFGAIAGAVAGPLIGGLLGGSEGGKGQQATQKQELDPRIAQYLYGSNGSTGLLGHTDNTLQQQMAQGGLNGMQTAGLEKQRQALMDPRYTQGFDQMRNLGASLMGGGAAGNPFTNGSMGANGQMRPQQPQGGSTISGTASPYFPDSQQQPPQGAVSAAYQPISAPAPYTPPAPPPAAPQMDFAAQMREYQLQEQLIARSRGHDGGGGN